MKRHEYTREQILHIIDRWMWTIWKREEDDDPQELLERLSASMRDLLVNNNW